MLQYSIFTFEIFVCAFYRVYNTKNGGMYKRVTLFFFYNLNIMRNTKINTYLFFFFLKSCYNTLFIWLYLDSLLLAKSIKLNKECYFALCL